MDLRKKTTRLQAFGEILLRFRLIFLVVFAVLYVIFARDFSVSIGDVQNSGFAAAKEISALSSGEASSDVLFLSVFGGIFLALFLLRVFLGGFSAAAGFLVSAVLVFAGCVSLGCCPYAAYVVACLFVVSMVFYFVVRVALFKAFLPVMLSAFFWIAVSHSAGLPLLFTFSFVALSLADALAVSARTGRELSLGTPVAGSLVAGFSGAVLSRVVSAVLLGGFFGYFYFGAVSTVLFVVFPLVSVALFLFAEFPMVSFAPLAKLRAEHRTMKI